MEVTHCPLLRIAMVLMTLNCFCCFDRKPTSHCDHLSHGCCSTGSTACAYTVLESGLMPPLPLRPNVRVCLPDGKCMLTWPLAIGKKNQEGYRSSEMCIISNICVCLTLHLIMSSLSPTSQLI